MKPFVISLLLFMLLGGCRREVKTNDFSALPQEKIDFFSHAQKSFDDIIPGILTQSKYIKLDTKNKDHLFARIDKIKVTNDLIYILDWRLRRLIVFNHAGEVLGRIGRIGNGPGEYLQITDFDVDENKNIFIVDGQKKKILCFDKQFIHVNTFTPSFDIEIIQCLPEQKFMLGLTGWNTEEYKGVKIVLCDNNFKVMKSYLKYDEFIDNGFRFSRYFFTGTGPISYNQSIDNTIYVFSQNGEPKKTYVVDFGKKNVPDKEKIDIESKLAHYDNYCFLINPIYTDGLSFIGKIMLNNTPRLFWLDKNNRDLYVSKNIEIDSYIDLVGFSHNEIIFSIYPGQDLNQLGGNIPRDIKKHLESEQNVIMLYTIK